MNNALQQQVEQVLGKPAVIPEEFAKLLQLISETYDHYELSSARLDNKRPGPQEVFGMYLKLTKEIGQYKKIISELTSDISVRKEVEQKLEQRNKELMMINAELDSFVYNASHELRAPLSSLLGLISLARVGEENKGKSKLFDLMETSIERLDIFIKDIVNFAKNSRVEIESERIDFNILINECIAHLKYVSGRENIKITIEVKEDAEFCSDKKRISVVMNNLLSNAIKYYNPQVADPFIHIHVSQNSQQAVCEISDNGMGIPETHIDKIFQMFVRATEKQSGSGLGLYIVYEIIEKMNGGVSVQSQEGKGSTFRFHIPNLCNKNSL